MCKELQSCSWPSWLAQVLPSIKLTQLHTLNQGTVPALDCNSLSGARQIVLYILPIKSFLLLIKESYCQTCKIAWFLTLPTFICFYVHGCQSRRKTREPKEENVTLGPAVREGEQVFGVAHIFASFNDTFIVSITCLFGVLFLKLKFQGV